MPLRVVGVGLRRTFGIGCGGSKSAFGLSLVFRLRERHWYLFDGTLSFFSIEGDPESSCVPFPSKAKWTVQLQRLFTQSLRKWIFGTRKYINSTTLIPTHYAVDQWSDHFWIPFRLHLAIVEYNVANPLNKTNKTNISRPLWTSAERTPR
jgi:hypothetical protein